VTSSSQNSELQGKQTLSASSSSPYSIQSTTPSDGELVKRGEVAAADMLLVDWSKSRSLEDILLVTSAASPPRSLGHGQGHVTSHWAPGSASSRDDSPLSGHAGMTATNVTGHTSLHGSLEMIQVS